MSTAPDLLLVPRPQRLRSTGGHASVDVPLRTAQTDGLRAEGFRLTIEPDGVTLEHRDDNGRRYGLACLDQITAQSPDQRLPCLVIEDWPDFPVRGFMLDISRDRVPTRATLERLVAVMTLARVNLFQLYTEHTFAYRDHEVVWRDASPMTPDDIRWLDAHCHTHGIELVPNQNCFGHMDRWLKHDRYRDRAEAPDGFEFMAGMHRAPTVLQPTPENADFALALFDELLPNFSSRQVAVNCDETFELGLGASRADVERRGREAVYVEHLLRIAEPLHRQGYRVHMWADVLRRDPSLAKQLPDDIVLGAWSYEAPSKRDPEAHWAGMAPQLRAALDRLGIDLSAHRSFADNVAPLVDAGLSFWVVPGTSSWLSLVGRVDNAVDNLVDAAATGLEHDCGGYVVTDWGDGGHMQPPSVSFGPLLFGGAVSWSLAANRDLDLPAVLDRFVFGDGSGRLGGALDSIGRAWRKTGQRSSNSSPLYYAVASDMAGMVGREPVAAELVPLVDELDAAMATIEASDPTSTDADLVRHELATATRLARHGAYRLLRQAGGSAPDTAALRTDLAEGIQAQREAWLARARPGGLEDSLAHLEHTLAEYG